MKIYGKKEPLERIGSYFIKGRIPHAIMLTGNRGVGKRTFADYIAMTMMCGKKTAEPCFACNECQRIENHIHPDVSYPLREMKTGKYNTNDLTEFMSKCYTIPNDSDVRLCIFEDADGMNNFCQNALLKFIEEPLPFNRFIFTVSDKNLILETILSRVTEIRIGETEESDCLSALFDNGISYDDGEKLFRSFGGNIGACLKAHEDEAALILYNCAEKIAENLCERAEYNCLAGFTSCKSREDISEVLRLLTDVFSNAAAIKVGGKTYGFFPKCAERISDRMTLKKLMMLAEKTSALAEQVNSNPNISLYAANCCASLFALIDEQK